MGIAITSIGVKVSWAVETTAGVRPTTGYKLIHDLKELPDTNAAPNTEDATTFDNTKNTSYVNLLSDLGGALTIVGNLTQQLESDWAAMCEAYETAVSAGKCVWMCWDIPRITEAVYLPIEPTELRIGGITANSLIEQNLYVTVLDDIERGAKPTYS